MTAVSADELAGAEMHPTWAALAPVKAYRAALEAFLKQELPREVAYTAAGLTLANQLANEFTNEIWPHYVPTTWELVLADRAGRLDAKVAELNQRFTEGG